MWRSWPLLAGRVVELAMAKQEDTLRWQFLLDEDRWESRSGAAGLLDRGSEPGANSLGRVYSIRLWALTVAAIVLAGAVSVFWLWRAAQAGLEEVRDELSAAIELEIWADEQGDRAMAGGLLDKSASSTWRNQIITRFFPLPGGDEHQISAHIPDDWQGIRSGLRLWLIWKVDGTLAQSRSDIVRWLYTESLAARGKGYTSRPQNYPTFCQGFWLWQLRHYEIGIPLSCDQTEGQIFTPVKMPLTLRQLPIPDMDPEFRGAWTRLNTGRAVAVASLFNLVERTYGPASVPELLAQTPHHLRWHSLVSDALGIPAPEFEASWQAHVRQLAGIGQ